MIKENKDKQREKNGNSSSVKTDLSAALISQASESIIKEEANEDIAQPESDGESNSKKNGLQGIGSTQTVRSSICSLSEHNPIITAGTINVQNVANRASTSSQGSGDVCLPDATVEDIKPEEGLLQDATAIVKTEINGNTKHEFSSSVGTTSDPCDNVLSLGLPLPTTAVSTPSTGPPPNGVQPLPSNVINKQPGTMEAQYMQQQSQIFVFSTSLANKSAEAVLQGHFPSIIAYHCAQPGTKKYLEKHPLKMNQFNRQNPAQWLNSLAQMKQKGGPGITKGLPSGFQNANIIGEISANPTSGSGIGVWSQANNGVSNNPANSSTSSISNTNNSCNNSLLNCVNPSTTCGNSLLSSCSNNIIPRCTSSQTGTMKTPGIDSLCLMATSPNTNSIMSTLGAHSPNVSASNTPLLPGAPDIAGSPVMNHANIAQPSLTGVKVPDENLTPQQRQHREEQLATLRKMQQMLFPEHQPGIPEGGNLAHTSEGIMHGLGTVISIPGVSGTNSNSASGSVSGTPGSGTCAVSTPNPSVSLGSGAGSNTGSVSGPGSVSAPGPTSGLGTGPGPTSGQGPGSTPGSGPGSSGGSGPSPSSTSASTSASVSAPASAPISASASGSGPVPAGATASSVQSSIPGAGVGTGSTVPGAVNGPAPNSASASGTTSVPGTGMGIITGPTNGSGNTGANSSAILVQKNLMPGIASNSITPTSAAAQIEWQKLQHQFYEERKKKSNNVSNNTGTGNDSPVGPSTPSSSGSVCTGNRTPVQNAGNQCPSNVTSNQGSRTQGPPPPYHPTARSASVPTAMSSPNPASPNNPTSNLSLPSPRTTSGLNSPSDSNRSQFTMGGGNSNSTARLINPGPSPTGALNTSSDSPTGSRPLHVSNPSTPVSTHLSPSATRKDNLQSGSDLSLITPTGGSHAASTTVPSHQPSVDNMFCRTLQSFAQQKQQQLNSNSTKEPNLMPVPSPQQIQYLNAFEGQELTIQKQPNTSLKETSIQSPSVTPTANDGSSCTSDLANSRMSGPATPLTPSSAEFNTRCPPSNSDVNRFPIPSPHTPGSDRSQPAQSQSSLQQSQTSTQQTPQQASQQSQPLTPQQRDRFPGPSPQSQGPRTPGIESTIKTPTTEVASHFLSSSPQMNENSSQNRFSNSSGSASGTSPAIGNQNPTFLPQTPSISNMKVSQFLDVSPSSTTSAVVDVSPTNSGNFSCLRSENVPLNPNSNGGVPCSGKIAHFDPITSMAQMSQQLTSSVANSPGSQPPTLMSGVPSGACPSGMLSFNPSGMHALQMNEIGNCTGLTDSQPSGSMGNIGSSNPNGSGNFGNIQIQNIPPHSFSPNSSVTNMVQCSGTVSTTSCMNQPIAHPNTSSSPKPGNIMVMGGPPRGSSPYSSSPAPQRMMGRPPGPSPYNGANVQVKPNAPNTIQYLPAKPQAGNTGPRGPLSLDFLQRFANPLSNLDSKVPTHNLQYFPNNNLSNPGNVSGLNVPLNRPNGLMNSMNSQMGLPGSNCAIGGHVGNPINNLSGPIMSPNGPMVGMNLPMTGSLVMGPGGPGVVPLRGGIRPSGMMRMQQMGNGMFNVPGNSGQPVSGEQMFGRGSPQNIGNGPNSQVFVPGSKSSPLGLGNTPDASQPLPPSMGQSNNFKNPPFIATSDPNYAQQFHNFQQQLYATNTRSQMNNQGVGPNQSFFVPK